MECILCDSTFQTKKSLIKHLRIHLQTSKTKTYKIVTDEIDRLQKLKTHICDDCGKTFSCVENLFVHQKNNVCLKNVVDPIITNINDHVATISDLERIRFSIDLKIEVLKKGQKKLVLRKYDIAYGKLEYVLGIKIGPDLSDDSSLSEKEMIEKYNIIENPLITYRNFGNENLDVYFKDRQFDAYKMVKLLSKYDEKKIINTLKLQVFPSIYLNKKYKENHNIRLVTSDYKIPILVFHNKWQPVIKNKIFLDLLIENLIGITRELNFWFFESNQLSEIQFNQIEENLLTVKDKLFENKQIDHTETDQQGDNRKLSKIQKLRKYLFDTMCEYLHKITEENEDKFIYNHEY